MDLILWRHAEAEEAHAGLPDQERPLTPRGKRQARDMAHWLLKHLPDDTRILVSPALRTRQTADALRREYRVETRIGTLASPADLLSTVGWPDAATPVLIVGHQPTLGQLAALLMTGKSGNWAVKKGAAWWLSTIGGNTRLRAVLGPDLC